MRIARRYLISGRVQGVGFRLFTEISAYRDGIDGWVRNTPDDRVEIEAEGAADAMTRFEQQIRHGPPGARVDQVDVADVATPLNLRGFHVR